LNNIFKIFTKIFIITILIKAIDIVKSLIIASKFGVSSSADIFMAVISIPESMIVLLGLDTIRGVVNSEYSSYLSNGEKRKIQDSFKNIFNFLIFFSLILVILLIIFRYQIISILLPGFSGDNLLLAVDISIVIFPIFFFKTFIGFFHSIYNAFHRFYFPIIAPIVITIIVLISIILPYYKNDLVYNLSFANLIGNAILSFILITGIYKMGMKPVIYKLEIDDTTKRILKSCLSILTLVIINQLYIFSKNFFVSYYGKGAISSLNYASYVPVAITSLTFAIIFNALLTNLSSYFSLNQIDNAKKLFLNTLLGLFYILVPICILFVLYGNEILKLVFLRGNFDLNGIEKTLQPFIWESLSMLTFIFYIIPTALYLAKKEYILLTKIGSAVYIFGILLNFVFAKIIGYYGVVVSGFFVTGIYGIFLIIFSRKIINRFDFFVKHFCMIILNGLFTFVFIYLLKEVLFKYYFGNIFVNNLIIVLINFVLIFSLFILFSYFLKINYFLKIKEIYINH
jgi:putative peptidoglycan lipid II flippase